MQRLLTAFFLFFSLATHAQNTQGVVTYERVQHWSRIAARLPYLSREEKDRIKLTWGYDEGWKQKMKLSFSPARSTYTYATDRAENAEGTYSWRNQEFVLHRNFEGSKRLDVLEMLGRVYIVDDSLRTPSWKISNQLKEVAGYLCVKATTEDTLKKQKITAWFAQDIPSQAGPEQYFGLPGLILELDINDGDAVVTATNVEFRDAAKDLTPPKAKGRKINGAEYTRLVRNHINDSVKSNRNPYWAMRY